MELFKFTLITSSILISTSTSLYSFNFMHLISAVIKKKEFHMTE